MINQNSTDDKKIPKILLMGKAGVGKTSMRAIIFANTLSHRTKTIGYTHGVASNSLTLMGNKQILLLDCGGQDQFWQEYLNSKQDEIFSNVNIFIFVMKAKFFNTDKFETSKNLLYLRECLKLLKIYSENAKIFVLFNKFDMIEKSKRNDIFGRMKAIVKENSDNIGLFITDYFATSIWEISLYRAWIKIVSSLISNYSLLNNYLEELCNLCNAEEVILFDKPSFLSLAHYSKKTSFCDDEKFEILSFILKKFQLAFKNTGLKFDSIAHKTKNFYSHLIPLTKSTFLAVITPINTNPLILTLNIDSSRQEFENILSIIA